MFEITGDDIAALSDGDLRTLIALLCEADLRRKDLPTAAVTAGGNQDAADGGVDVRVALPPGTIVESFIPRCATVFQSKASDMPRNAILREMRPGDILRPAIVELAEADGAYIIVSPGASLSETMLSDRKSAMKEALRGLPKAASLTLDFYDRARVATWVRDHPGLIPWVRERIGRSLRGWRSFGRWSARPVNADAGYLIDDAARIRMPGQDVSDGLSAVDGINQIRAELRHPGKAVRLVGLSGVGKTRLAEALFDPAIGQDSLDPSLAIYTDTADEPDPSPGSLAGDLIAGQTRAILLVDNCPPETHRRLTEIVTAAGGTISLLTIEYDIQDGEPEETAVFELATSSPAVIEQLVSRRYPTLSEVDVRTIAEFSGGNARIALALAGRDPRRGSFAGLNDKLLFERLFWQRNDPDASLLAIAQVCALLYSFEGEMLDGEGAELPIIGGLIGRTADAVHIAAAELKRRQLLQARTRWRAVLPHAVANRLAAIALQDIPRQRLIATLVEGTSERVLRSFSRRLGYLDASAEAQEIVRSWFAPDGLLADIQRLNNLGIAMLTNVAPVAPEATLSALEAAMREVDDSGLGDFAPFARLLRALAYEPAQFERAAALLVRLARLPKENRPDGDAAEILEALFPIRLSGTLAPLDMRLTVVDRLMRSADEAEQHLGVRLLRAVLQTDRFSSWQAFEFGARSRGYGLHPRSAQEMRDWYAAGLACAAPLLTADGAVADDVRSAVAQAFRGLWVRAGQAASLKRLVHAVIGARGLWHDGWVAVRQTRIYCGEQLTSDALAELGALEDALRPQSIADKVRSAVLHGGGSFDLDDLDDAGDDITLAMNRQAAVVTHLAQDVADDKAAWQALLPEVAAGSGPKVQLFGKGLAAAAEAPRTVWAALVEQTGALPAPGISALCGFLQGIERRNGALVRALLDEALEDPILAPWMPVLQAATTFDEAALVRLHCVLTSGAAPIERFSRLAYGGVSDGVEGSALARLLLQIAKTEGGGPVSRNILYMRFFSDRSAGREIHPDLVEIGRTLLLDFQFEHGHGSREDYELASIARVSLAGEGGRAAVQDIGRTLALAMGRYEVGLYDYDDLIYALFEAHPTQMLDALLDGDEPSNQRIIRLLNELPRSGKPLMGGVPDDVLFVWCGCAPVERYPLAASFAPLFAQPDERTQPEWTCLTRRLLTDAPDPVLVFETIISRLHPTSWSGSLAEVLSSRLDLLERLDIAALPALEAPMERARAALRGAVDRERQRERDEDRQRDGRFE